MVLGLDDGVGGEEGGGVGGGELLELRHGWLESVDRRSRCIDMFYISIHRREAADVSQKYRRERSEPASTAELARKGAEARCAKLEHFGFISHQNWSQMRHQNWSCSANKT